MRVTRALLAAVLSLSACAPVAGHVEAGVALDPALVRRVLSERCHASLPLVADLNPGLDEDAWIRRLLAGDTTAVASPHVRLDDDALAECTAALDGDDCRAVERACLPLSRFFVGTLADGQACGTAFDCEGDCILAGDGCGVCAACASNLSCGDGEVCIDGTCTAPRRAGEACPFGVDVCADGLVCANDTCTPARAAGENCGDGVCTGGLVCGPLLTCVVQAEDGAVCADDRHCASGRCDLGLCAPLPTTGDCHLGRCGIGSRCDDDGQCVPVAAGDVCASEFDCDLAHTCADGRCVPRRAPGETCTAAFAGECAEGTACNINHTGGPFRCRALRARVGLGERCETALCAVGQCVADRTGEERCIEPTFGLRVGDACTPAALATCAHPLVCAAATASCVAPTVVEPGEACDEERVCRGELLGTRCEDGRCVARGGEGDECAIDRRRRDGVTDDGCDATSTLCSGGTCLKADAGSACDVSCLPGLRCDDGQCVDDVGLRERVCAAP